MKHKKIFENGKYVPQRMCVACRGVRPKAEMIRVAFFDGEVMLGGGSGRGAYVCNNKDCIEKAEKTRGLQRGLKTNVSSEIYRECMEYDGK